MSNRILIAEDETRIAAFVEKGLRSNGFTDIARWTTLRLGASTLSSWTSGYLARTDSLCCACFASLVPPCQ